MQICGAGDLQLQSLSSINENAKVTTIVSPGQKPKAKKLLREGLGSERGFIVLAQTKQARAVNKCSLEETLRPFCSESAYWEEKRREENDEHLELRGYCSQTHQRHPLLRRQFHQPSRPQSHYRVSTRSFPLFYYFRVPSSSFIYFQFHWFRCSFFTRKCTRIEIHLLTPQGLQVFNLSPFLLQPQSHFHTLCVFLTGCCFASCFLARSLWLNILLLLIVFHALSELWCNRIG